MYLMLSSPLSESDTAASTTMLNVWMPVQLQYPSKDVASREMTFDPTGAEEVTSEQPLSCRLRAKTSAISGPCKTPGGSICFLLSSVLPRVFFANPIPLEITDYIPIAYLFLT
jgi:hypothetical protein